MDMNESKFIYEYRSPFIFVLSIKKEIDNEFAKSILNQIIELFEKFYKQMDEQVKLNKDLLISHLKQSEFTSKFDFFITEVILADYFKYPSKIIDEIESILTNLFGSVGKSIVENAIQKVCRNKANFKSEDLKHFVSQIENSLARKIDSDQLKMITQQIQDIFMPNPS